LEFVLYALLTTTRWQQISSKWVALSYHAASVVDDVAFDGDAQQLPFSVLNIVAEVNVRRSVDHVHLHTNVTGAPSSAVDLRLLLLSVW